MKKSSKVLLLVITIMSIFIVMTISSSAYTSGDFTYSVSNGNATITDYIGSATELEIPSTINGYTVTSIGSSAFEDCRSLQSITIPDSVTSIGDYAFYSCDSLQNMYYTGTADDWVKISFDNSASNPMCYAENEYFNGELVTDVVLSEGLTSINNCAFYNCTSLQSITIPDSVTSIGYEAFRYCSSLQNITIPDSVTSIGSYAFYGCTSLKSITIPDSVTSIGDYAFYNCDSLQSITIPDSVTSIGEGAFYNCNLENVIIGNSVTDLNAFDFDENLKTIQIGNSVTSIGDYAFFYCDSLQSITIPNSVTSIGSYAFYNCTSLQSITIGDSVTSIGNYAFYYCYDLWHVLYTGTESQWSEITIGSYNSNLTNATRHCKVKSNPINETLTKAPTCIEDGSKTLSCSICETEKDFTITPLGHDFHFTETITPTCLEEGYNLNHCSRCGAEERDCYTAILEEHNFEDGICVSCKGLEVDCVSSPHNYPDNYDNTWVISKPDATKIKVTFSEKTYTETDYDIIYIYDANDNLIGKYSGSQLAGVCVTVNSDKVKIRLTSDNQENNYGFSVKKVEAVYCEHEETEIRNAIDVTCESDGYSGDVYCADCGVLVENGNTIPATGHTSSNWIIDEYSTCTTDGSKHKECTVCGDWLETEVIEKVGHMWGDWITEDPTCEDEGATMRACAICGEIEGGQIPALGHDYATEYTVDKEPTYTSAGSKSKHCSRCDAKIDVTEIEKLYYGSKTYTGLYKVDGTWRYVKNGELDNTYTGLVKYSGKYYYVKNGVKTSFNGLVKYNSKWYYVKSGVVNTSYTGLVKHTDGKYYYVKSGVKTSFNGLVKYNSKWYYVKSGVVNTSYTGLVKHTDGKYYYVKSGVKTSFNGLVKYNSKWYYVKSGVVNTSYTGLVKHIDGKWYYVKKGVKTSYTGTVTYNGKTYKVVNGVKV